MQLSALCASMIALHVCTPEFLWKALHSCWPAASKVPLSTLEAMTRYTLGAAVAALAGGSMGHATMADEDVEAAMAAVRAAIPAISRGSEHFCRSRDKVKHAPAVWPLQQLS